MEVTLSQLAERWNNIVWGMDPYKGGDVPLLKIAEEDFEALEVLVQIVSTADTKSVFYHSSMALVRQIQIAAAELYCPLEWF